jgi:hypothetical protein
MTEQPNTPAADLAKAVGLSTDLLDMDPRKLGAARMEIKHPITKVGTGQYIWLLNIQHPKVQNFINGEADAELAKEADWSARGKTAPARTVEQGNKRTIDLVTVATDRWEGVNFNKETDVQFTVQKARELYAVPFIREQCVEFMRELDGFTQG